MSRNILKVTNLKKNYINDGDNTEALKSVNFEVEENEFISIVGPSGCGKSTILSIIANLCDQTEGIIEKDKNINVGYMLQNDALLPWKNIYENCILGLEIQGKKNENTLKYVNYLINSYGLSDFKYKYPENLSGGMRQRVALIRTLALKPNILLLDEPLSALDAQTRLTISNDIFDIIKKEKKTAIMVTHDIGELKSIIRKLLIKNYIAYF